MATHKPYVHSKRIDQIETHIVLTCTCDGVEVDLGHHPGVDLIVQTSNRHMGAGSDNQEAAPDRGREHGSVSQAS